jgi:hypothetical protein
MRAAVVGVLVAFLASCATGPRVGRTHYGPRADSRAGYGYSDLQLNQRSFRVEFVSESQIDAQEGAMLRAAEVTLSSGFDGFVISDTADRGEQRIRSRFVVGRVRRNVAVAELTIDTLMRGEFAGVPPGSVVYDARLLMQRYRLGAPSP